VRIASGEERVAGLRPELAATWRLHVHDLGAEVSERLAGLRTRGSRGEAEDAQAGQRPGLGLGGEAVSVHGVLVSSRSDGY
jgi:hypothetical protein